MKIRFTREAVNDYPGACRVYRVFVDGQSEGVIVRHATGYCPDDRLRWHFNPEPTNYTWLTRFGCTSFTVAKNAVTEQLRG